MRTRAWMRVCVLGAAAVVAACDGKDPGADHSPDKAPKPNPAASASVSWPASKRKNMFATNDYRGRNAPEVKVEKWLTAEPDRKGKVVLVDFWATWCPPCRGLIPELNEWQKQFKDDLVVIGVSDEPAPKVEEFMQKTKVEYAMAVDTRKNEMTKSQIGIMGIPHVLVIDSTGMCRWQGFPQSGEDPLTTETLKQIIASDKAQRAEQGKKVAESPSPSLPPASGSSPAAKPPSKP